MISTKRYSENGLLITWKNVIDDHITKEVIQFHKLLNYVLDEYIIDSIPAYNSLFLSFKNTNYESFIEKIMPLYNELELIEYESIKKWHLPIYINSYSALISVTSKSPKEYIEQFLSCHFMISMKGFLPGFLYLSGLDEELSIPRKTVPLRRIIKGSVAVGGKQAGVYSANSPGGWHTIGLCPIPTFFVHDQRLSSFLIGDKIDFYPITEQQYYSYKKTDWNIDLITSKFQIDE